MLRELTIRNLALVEELHLEPASGLVVLTGETGAGKSMILQAIHLLSGGRADSSWVRSGTEESSVEALFDFPRTSLVPVILTEKGLPVEDSLVIRRLISNKGKSRFYVNGAMTTARIVAEIAEHLLSVASQHEHQQLLQSSFHLEFIDLAGGLQEESQEVENLYDAWQQAIGEYERMAASRRETLQRQDLLTFQVNEIEAAALEPGEDERLEIEKRRLRSVEQLQNLGGASHQLLDETVYPALQQCKRDLDRMAALDETVGPLAERVAGLGYELEDGVHVLRAYLESLPSDAQQIETVAERLHQIGQLKRKYGPSIEEVIAYGTEAARELSSLGNVEENLENLRRLADRAEKNAVERARQLSAKRRKAAQSFEEMVSRELQSLCMEHARFEVRFQPEEQRDSKHLHRHGFDEPEFYFSANPGEPAKALVRVASGGELSRLMLAFRCILARRDKIDTVIFDEIDAGVSGQAAESVARKVRELSGHHQVLCITHLAQIAARAEQHFLVEKEVLEQRTKTRIIELAERERAPALAKMLDGASVSGKTMEYVQELLWREGKGKSRGEQV